MFEWKNETRSPKLPKEAGALMTDMTIPTVPTSQLWIQVSNLALLHDCHAFPPFFIQAIFISASETISEELLPLF